MRILIYALFLFYLFGCNTNNHTDIILKKGKAIIEGKVHNFNDDSRVLRFTAIGVIEDIEKTAILDSLGNFKLEIELFNPQNINLFYKNGFAALYLVPGDSLFLDLDANIFNKENYPYFKATGQNSSTTNNIRDYLHFHNPYTYKPVYNKSMNEFLNDLKNQMNIEDSVLNVFFMKEIPTDKFKYWAQNEIRYSLANYLVGYFHYHAMNYKQYKTDVFNTNLFPVDKDSAIVSFEYLAHLSNYAITKYIVCDSIFTRLSKKKDFRNAYSRVFDNIIKNEIPGLSRDIMVYKIFHGFYEVRPSGISLDSVEAMWNSYKNYINNPVLLKTVNEDMIISENHTYKKDDSINQTYKYGDSINQTYKYGDSIISNSGLKFKSVRKYLEALHSKHKDKIIYIDIWAVWCGPCRAEIPFEVELQEYFKDKPVAFVNLCMASKKEDWEKVVSQNHIKGDNYFFNEEETNLFRSDLIFPGYPTYMIMDKKGNLINKNAPRPSSGVEIRNILSKQY